MRFRSELQTPGVRIPITADADLWTKGVEVGEEILWLHTFGQRYTDESKGRPEGLSALCETIGPRVLAEIPDVAEGMPSEIDYDPENRQLMVGGGRIGPVSRRVYEYDVGGMRIVRHWFNYRSANPRYKRRTSPLDDENCETWTSSLTDDLLALLAVLERCTQLEDTQTKILADVCNSPIISVEELTSARVLPPSVASRRPIPVGEGGSLSLF